MAVGKGSILRASNAVKEKASETKDANARNDVSDLDLRKEATQGFSGNELREVRKAKEVFWIPIAELHTQASAKMTRQQERILEASLSKYGFLTPILVWKNKSGTTEELIVLDGLKRIEIAKKINIKEAPVLISQAETVDSAREVRQELHALSGCSTMPISYEIEQGITSQLPVYLL